MQGLYFEPSGYFDDKLKRRDSKRRIKAKSKQSTSSKSDSLQSMMYQSRSNHLHNVTNSAKSSSKSKPSKSLNTGEDVFAAYQKKLKRRKRNKSRQISSNGVQELYSIEKDRITKDKFSRLFHDFEQTKSHINTNARDQNFRNKLAILNQNKQKNKADSYELIRQYFDSILDKKHSKHPLALLITRFCNLFHGQYSFSPEDFKNKSIYQMYAQFYKVYAYIVILAHIEYI